MLEEVKEAVSEVTFTRRTFLKVAAVAGAAVAISAPSVGSLVETDKAYAASPTVTKKVKTTCHGCIQACPCIVTLEDGVAVMLDGDPRAPISKGSLCIKGMNQLHTVYSPRRVLHPMKLAGPRGSNKWEAISWDDAVTLAATQITTIIDKYGPYSFFATVGGGGAYSFIQALSFPSAFGAPTTF